MTRKTTFRVVNIIWGKNETQNGKNEIQKMLTELKVFPILKWTRGQKWINFDKLIDTIFVLQYIFREFNEISEIDINPIFSDENECLIVDAKFYL